jgi:tetratricopeptide (TPR) repeat protein
MGLFNWLFRSQPAFSDPAQLLQALTAATSAGDKRTVDRLCRANRAIIEGHFSAWQKPGDAVRRDPAVELTKRGEKLAVAGKHEDALATFREAGKPDQFDPQSRYLEAFTLLHLGRFSKAIEAYQIVEQLAPGWFHCRTDLWLAEQLAAGRVNQGTFLALHILEDGPQSPEEKYRLVQQVLASNPDLAPLHLVRGKALSRLGRVEEAREAFRRGLACAAEPDIKTRLLLELSVLTDEPQVRTRLLREALSLAGNLVAAAMAQAALAQDAK